jgi:hypothetical protein
MSKGYYLLLKMGGKKRDGTYKGKVAEPSALLLAKNMTRPVFFADFIITLRDKLKVKRNNNGSGK